MSKKMLINATHLEENRVAIVEDGILTELDIEIAGKEQTKGNIYKAAVVRVESGLQAAFVDYGGDRLGFLQMGEIHPSLFRNRENKGRPRINDVLHRGQELLVQIVKEERGTKGAALTTFLSLPGRYMVLMPDSDTKGVSRKIADEGQRRKLKETMASLDLPESFGYIVRTAAIAQSKEELKRDFTYLQRLYESIESLNRKVKPPALVYRESNLIIRSIRDYFSTDMDEVLVDDPKVFQEARDFFQQVMPEYARLVKLHQERRPIYARYQIEEQIETISKAKVPLPSGGSIVIDSTEALVAVDVNSGKLAGEQGVEATAYRTNLEAAAEVGRQLRLRDLGGLIVIDFIDMRERKHDRDVEKRLKQALKNDKARVTVGRISQFGLLEMSRQRIKATLAEGAYLTCTHCNGSGRIKSVEAQAVAFMRKVQAGIAKGQIGTVEGEIPLDVAIYLLNTKREELHEMERQRDIEIFIKGRPDFVAGQAELDFRRRSAEKEKEEVVEAGALPEPLAAEPEPLPIPPAGMEEKESATGEEGNGKRKRRRRRRRKSAAAKAAEGAGRPAAAEAAEEVKEEKEQKEPAAVEERTLEQAAAAEPATPAESVQTAAEETAPKPARPGRGRKRKKPESVQEAVPETIAQPQQEAQAKAAVPEAMPPESEGEERPPRSRGRGRKKAEPETATTEVVEQKRPASEETAAGTETAETAESEKKPARARSRSRKKAEVQTAATEVVEQKKPVAEEKAAETAAETPAAAEAEKKPSRPRGRSRKKTEAQTAGTEAVEQKKPVSEEKAAEAPEAPEAEKKPAPSKGGRPKKAETQTAPAPADAVKAEDIRAGEVAPPEEKPKRRSRAKTGTGVRKTAAKEGTAAEATPAEKSSSSTPEEESKPAPRRGRPKKKTAENTAAEEEKSPAREEQPTEPEKPKRRSSRKKSEESEKAGGEKPATAKKAAPRKTAAESKTTGKKGEGTSEDAEESRKTPAKPRAPRKKAATAKQAEETGKK